MKGWAKLFSVFLMAMALQSGCPGLLEKPEPTPPIQEPVPGPVNTDPLGLSEQTGKFYRFGDRKTPNIALTFDDGPEANWTPKILDILRDKGVKATFFVAGKEAEKYPDITRRMVAEGHVIGNHTFNHVNLNNLPPEQMMAELDQGADAIAKITSKRPKLVRPPFGAQNPQVVEVVNNRGDFVILWSIDTEDWRGLDAPTIQARVLPIINNGDIILQHSGEGPNLQGTVDALPQLIDELRARGFNFVTIPQLLNIPDYQ